MPTATWCAEGLWPHPWAPLVGNDLEPGVLREEQRRVCEFLRPRAWLSTRQPHAQPPRLKLKGSQMLQKEPLLTPEREVMLLIIVRN